ncbi:MAG: hypothetical protein R6U36_11010 [Candidatus Fermentibacteraceae bacterium]
MFESRERSGTVESCDSGTYGRKIGPHYDRWYSEVDPAMLEVLESRWGGWSEESFRDGCGSHVSVYVLPDG